MTIYSRLQQSNLTPEPSMHKENSTIPRFRPFFFVLVFLAITSCSSDDNSPDAETTLYVGQLILSGDITNEEAKTKINEYTGFELQSLIIRNTVNLTSLELPEINTLVNLEIINNQQLAQLAMPNLTHISIAANISDNDALAAIYFPKLENVGDINVQYNLLLQEIVLPELQEVENEFYVSINSGLTVIDINKAATVRSLIIASNENLRSLKTDMLSVIDDRIYIANNNMLTTIGFPELRSCGELIISLNDILNVVNLEALTSVSSTDHANVTTYGNLSISGGENLVDVTLGNLEKAGIIRIANDALETIALPKLVLCEYIVTFSDKVLTSVQLDALQEFESLDFDDSTFSSDVMDTVLGHLVSITPAITGKTLKFSGDVSTTGQEHIELLTNKGNTITFKE